MDVVKVFWGHLINGVTQKAGVLFSFVVAEFSAFKAGLAVVGS